MEKIIDKFMSELMLELGIKSYEDGGMPLNESDLERIHEAVSKWADDNI